MSTSSARAGVWIKEPNFQRESHVTKPTLQDAIALAKRAHNNQKDKAGMAYFGHLERVMNHVEGDDLKIIAILHDSIEDTFVTREYLRDAGYSEQIIAAIEALTKQPDEEGSDVGYEKFVRRAAQNTLARKVKIADLKDNMNLKRIAAPTIDDHARIRKYRKALTYLEALPPDTEYSGEEV
jgi:(p)ppGpp synthase/HD superfamily hydrolase